MDSTLTNDSTQSFSNSSIYMDETNTVKAMSEVSSYSNRGGINIGGGGGGGDGGGGRGRGDGNGKGILHHRLSLQGHNVDSSSATVTSMSLDRTLSTHTCGDSGIPVSTAAESGQWNTGATSPTKSSSSSIYPVDVSQYKILSEIGVGQYSKVWRAFCVPLNEQVAIKIIDLERYDDSILEVITKEINIMSSCNHENVVKFYTSFVHETNLYIVTELLEGGSIFDLMRYKYPNGLESEELIASILKQTLKALDYFHTNGHIHRHVKSSNILVDSRGRVRIADFGVSARLIEGGDRKKIRQTLAGSPCWMAPEVMEQLSGYEYKADIWSLGITAIEMARGKAPLQDFPPMKVMLLTLNNPPPTLDISDKRYSKTFKEVIDLCLKKPPSKRPTAQQLLKHKFFAKTRPPEYVKDKLLYNMIPLDDRVVILNRMREQEEERRKEEQRQRLGHQAEGEIVEKKEDIVSEGTPDSSRKPPSGWDWNDVKHTGDDSQSMERVEEHLNAPTASATNSEVLDSTASEKGTESASTSPEQMDAVARDGTTLGSNSNKKQQTELSLQSEAMPATEWKPLKRIETRGRFVVETIEKVENKKEQQQQQDSISSDKSKSVPSQETSPLHKSVKRKGRFTVEEIALPTLSSEDELSKQNLSSQSTDSGPSTPKPRKRRSGRQFDIRNINESDLNKKRRGSVALSPMPHSSGGAESTGSLAKKPATATSLEKQLKELTVQGQQQLKIVNALFQMTKERDSLSHKYAQDNTEVADLVGKLQARVKQVLDENANLRLENEKLTVELNKYKRREKQRQQQQQQKQQQQEATTTISRTSSISMTPATTPGSNHTSDSEK